MVADALTDPQSADNRGDRYRGAYRRRVAVLVAAVLLVALVGNNWFPLLDRDEPLYAQTSRQMLEGGDWVLPRFLDTPRLKKPILTYWVQATSMRLFGPTAFAARLPSAIAMALTVALFASVLPRWIGHRRSLAAMFVFATMFLPAYLSKVSTTDAVLHLFVAGAMLALFALWRESASVTGSLKRPRQTTLRLTIVLGIAIGLAALTKGPPVLLYLGMTSVALLALRFTLPPESREPIRVRPTIFVDALIVLAIVALIGLPWIVPLERAYPGSIRRMFVSEVVDRGLVPQEGHAGPPGYYAATIWATAFPWSIFLPAALLDAWRRRAIPWVRFSLAAIVGPWLFLEVYKTKLPHYFLASYPFLALLIADVLIRSARGVSMHFRDRFFEQAVWFVGIALSLASLALWYPPLVGGVAPLGLLAATALTGLIVATTLRLRVLLRERRIRATAFTLGGAAWVILAVAFAAYLPLTPSLRLAERVGTDLRSRPDRSRVAPRAVEFKEPSLFFYAGGLARPEKNLGVVAALPAWPRYLVTTEEAWKDAGPLRERYTIAATHVGLNPAGDGLKPVTVLTLEKNPPLEKRPTPATMPASRSTTRR